jgi:hypothetical protein
MTPRTLIVCDDNGKWFVRRVRVAVHDLDRDEMVYHCNEPLSGSCPNLMSAVASLQRLPRSKRPKDVLIGFPDPNVSRATFTSAQRKKKPRNTRKERR